MYGISLWLLLFFIAVAMVAGWTITHVAHSILLGVFAGFATLFVLVVTPFAFLRRTESSRKKRAGR